MLNNTEEMETALQYLELVDQHSGGYGALMPAHHCPELPGRFEGLCDLQLGGSFKPILQSCCVLANRDDLIIEMWSCQLAF